MILQVLNASICSRNSSPNMTSQTRLGRNVESHLEVFKVGDADGRDVHLPYGLDYRSVGEHHSRPRAVLFVNFVAMLHSAV